MTPTSPSEVHELTVALDYGQFYLIGRRARYAVGEDHTLQLLDTAINGAGIASSEGNEVVVVLPPHQNNFAMRLHVELWGAQPPDDLDDWQEVFHSCRRHPDRYRPVGCAPGQARYRRPPDPGG